MYSQPGYFDNLYKHLSPNQFSFCKTLYQQILSGREFTISLANSCIFPNTPIEDLVQLIVGFDNGCQNGLDMQVRSEMVGFVILTYANSLIESSGQPLISPQCERIVHGFIQG